jgi:bacterioferritin-associated ferredoxin
MIVCSCNRITRQDIDAAVDALLDEDAFAVITPGAVFHRLGYQPNCAGCFPNLVDLIHQRRTQFLRNNTVEN